MLDIHTFTFAIAGAVFRLQSETKELVDSITRRYALFSCNLAPEFILDIRQVGKSTKVLRNPPGIGFRGGTLYFASSQYEGFVDGNHGIGKLNALYENITEGTDYFVRVATALMVFRRGGILIHAAGVMREAQVYIFIGHSGSGKTTIARNSPAGSVLNDDLIALMPNQTDLNTTRSWIAYSTPFWNPTQNEPTSQNGPVKAIFSLVHDKVVRIDNMGQAEASAKIIASVPILASNPEFTPILIERVLALLAVIPAYQLRFLPDGSFWPVIAASTTCMK